MKYLLVVLLWTISLPVWGGSIVILGGDAIGPDPNLTNGTGGFTAVDDTTGFVSGQPAV